MEQQPSGTLFSWETPRSRSGEAAPGIPAGAAYVEAPGGHPDGVPRAPRHGAERRHRLRFGPEHCGPLRRADHFSDGVFRNGHPTTLVTLLRKKVPLSGCPLSWIAEFTLVFWPRPSAQGPTVFLKVQSLVGRAPSHSSYFFINPIVKAYPRNASGFSLNPNHPAEPIHPQSGIYSRFG